MISLLYATRLPFSTIHILLFHIIQKSWKGKKIQRSSWSHVNYLQIALIFSFQLSLKCAAYLLQFNLDEERGKKILATY